MTTGTVLVSGEMRNCVAVNSPNETTNVVLRSFKDEDRLLVNYDDEDLQRIFG